MTQYLGDITPGKVLRFGWNSCAAAGGSISRATNGTISVYKDGNTTQSTTGVTDTEDFDALTGVHLVAIDTSADGTFYSAGSDFMVVLSAATIDGQTVNAVLAQFSIANRSALRPTTADRTLDVSSGGEAGIDLANVGSPATTLNLSGTTIKEVTDAATRETTIAGYLDTEIGAIKAKTDLIPAAPAAVGDIPTAVQNADALLKRDWTEVTGEAPRSVLNALRALRNKIAIASGTMSVKKEDDSTNAWTATVTTAAGNPLSSIDPD